MKLPPTPLPLDIFGGERTVVRREPPILMQKTKKIGPMDGEREQSDPDEGGKTARRAY